MLKRTVTGTPKDARFAVLGLAQLSFSQGCYAALRLLRYATLKVGSARLRFAVLRCALPALLG